MSDEHRISLEDLSRKLARKKGTIGLVGKILETQNSTIKLLLVVQEANVASIKELEERITFIEKTSFPYVP